MAKNERMLEIGGVRFNADYLRSVTEKKAISDYAHLKKSKVINAWKQANGLTKRNHSSSKKEESKDEKKS